MAYFNHAFNKVFLGTKNATAIAAAGGCAANPNQSSGVTPFASGFIIAGSNSTADLIDASCSGANLGPGSYGFFDPVTWTSVNNANLTSLGKVCCPLVLASTALYQKDQLSAFCPPPTAIGGFHGGYQESNKSKVINPKYISKWYRVDPCVPNQSVVAIGSTPYTFSQNLDCCFTFLCDQSYSLRIDIKGSPALRFLNHNAYYETATWTGCCPPNQLTPTPVDPTTVFIAWATQLINSPLICPFIQIIIYDQAGNAVGGANDTTAWAAYVPQPVVPCVPNQPAPGAGMVILGAYVDTVFGNCTFYPTDFFEKEPIKILASMVDHTGDVCAFTGICVTEQCCPRQGNGFGETVLRDLILSERYLQNDFYTGLDLRIREITQGYDVTNAVNRAGFYTRYYLLHSVPRFNNPTGVFDNDQYMLEIITNGIDTNLETFMSNWAGTCAQCIVSNPPESFGCGSCCPVPLVAPNGAAPNPYSFFVPSGPGTGSWVWSISVADAAALTALGLALNTATGEISGAVTVAGTANVTITVTDSTGLVTACWAVQVQVV